MVKRSFKELIVIVNTVLLISFIQAGAQNSAFKLGERFFEDKMYDLALEQYQKYLEEEAGGEHKAEALFRSGVCFKKIGEKREAAEAFGEYIKLYPMESLTMDAMMEAAKLRKDLGDYQTASDLFFTVWNKYSGSIKAVSALFNAAKSAHLAGNIDRAINLYQRYYDRFDSEEDAEEAYLSLIKLLIESGDYSRAEDLLGSKFREKREDDDEFNVRATVREGLLNYEMRNSEDAVKAFEYVFPKKDISFPLKYEFYSAYVKLLTKSKDFIKADSVFSEFDSFCEKEGRRLGTEQLSSWAENSMESKKYKRAVSLYKRMLSKNSGEVDSLKVQYKLAQAYSGMDEFIEAVSILRELENRDTKSRYSVIAPRKIGDIYYKQKIYSSAVGAYSRYLEVQGAPGKDHVLNRIGDIYKDSFRKYEVALQKYERLIKMYPGSKYYTPALYKKALCLEKIGQYEEALTNYNYVSKSSESGKYSEEAQARSKFLKEFKITEGDEAALKLVEIVASLDGSLDRSEKLLLGARIYSRHLKEHMKALSLLEDMEASISELSDSVKAEVWYEKGKIYLKLLHKAEMESSEKTAEHMKEQAEKALSAVVNTGGSWAVVDDARYELMMLDDPGIMEYEKYVERFPESEHAPDVYYQISRYYSSKAEAKGVDFYKKAVQAEKRLITDYPSNTYYREAMISLADNYLKLGKPDSAIKTAEMYLDDFKESFQAPEAMYISSVASLKKGDMDKAVEGFRSLIYRYPFSRFNEISRYKLGKALYDQNRIQEALNAFKVYLMEYPDGKKSDQANYGVAKCKIKMGEKEEALKIFRQLLNSNLVSQVKGDIHYELGREAQGDGEDFKAIEHYLKAADYTEGRRRADIHLRLGSLYYTNRMFRKAIGSFDAAHEGVVSRSDSIEVLLGKIKAMIMTGRKKSADDLIADFKSDYLDIVPEKMAEIFFAEGLYLTSKKEYDKAVKRFEYIIKKYSESDLCDDAGFRKAGIYSKQGKVDESLKLFQSFPEDFPESDLIPRAYFRAGMILFSKQEYARSAKVFEKCIDSDTSKSDLKYRAAGNAAEAYKKISSWLDASRMYTYMIENYPEKTEGSDIYIRTGFVFLQASRVEDALSYFNKASAGNPSEEDKPELIYWTATCYSRLGEYKKAISRYLKVPYLYPNSGKWGITAEFQAARLYERTGKYSKALSLYEKIVRTDGEKGRFGRKARERIQRISGLEDK